ncbi:hypothetical protein L596_021341 [Steinernema carpocapsae]|uniref:SXP/RAL-2 family protein Ani s 5-like cation-binding domain-containing protein n=1 Tax=Steinernema carpocapsae TaxID=34508 RepID=A0A4U5MII2_STECR|nr:hypothetical protein L596_021341 [Steinernema carpocapsae]
MNAVALICLLLSVVFVVSNVATAADPAPAAILDPSIVTKVLSPLGPLAMKTVDNVENVAFGVIDQVPQLAMQLGDPVLGAVDSITDPLIDGNLVNNLLGNLNLGNLLGGLKLGK